MEDTRRTDTRHHWFRRWKQTVWEHRDKAIANGLPKAMASEALWVLVILLLTISLKSMKIVIDTYDMYCWSHECPLFIIYSRFQISFNLTWFFSPPYKALDIVFDIWTILLKWIVKILEVINSKRMGEVQRLVSYLHRWRLKARWTSLSPACHTAPLVCLGGMPSSRQEFLSAVPSFLPPPLQYGVQISASRVFLLVSRFLHSESRGAACCLAAFAIQMNIYEGKLNNPPSTSLVSLLRKSFSTFAN